MFIVTYDIKDAKRLRLVFRTMRGYGDHLQYSVFRCELSEVERLRLMIKLEEIIKHDEDQVLFFPIGPAGGLRENNIYHVGLPYKKAEHGAIIV